YCDHFWYIVTVFLSPRENPTRLGQRRLSTHNLGMLDILIAFLSTLGMEICVLSGTDIDGYAFQSFESKVENSIQDAHLPDADARNGCCCFVCGDSYFARFGDDPHFTGLLLLLRTSIIEEFYISCVSINIECNVHEYLCQDIPFVAIRPRHNAANRVPFTNFFRTSL
ncbi:hypothetical protein ACJX0J_029066, partial [Zea mays]